MVTDDRDDDDRDDLAGKRFDKLVRNAGRTPPTAQGKLGFVFGFHGKSNDEVFDAFAPMLREDPGEMRRIAWEQEPPTQPGCEADVASVVVVQRPRPRRSRTNTGPARTVRSRPKAALGEVFVA